MLKPDKSKRDWFLFHMTPMGMGLGRTAKAGAEEGKRVALILLGGVMAVGVLLAAYFSL